MKSLKTILIGIAIILFGVPIANGASSMIGWSIMSLGLIVSLIGFVFVGDNENK